jgi:hypothetical protein
MSILSHEQRLFFYKKLLHEVCKDSRTHFGFCYYVPWTLVQLDGRYRTAYRKHLMAKDLIRIELPELYAIRPAKPLYYDFWYPNTPAGWQTRINKLCKIIKTMEK